MKRLSFILFAAMGTIWFCAGSANAQTADGIRLIEKRCASCHGNPASGSTTPDLLSLWKLTSEEVYAALSKAPHTSIDGLTDDEKRLLATTFGNRPVDVAQVDDAKLMPNKCASNPPISDLAGKPMWNGWGNGVDNGRFQTASAAGLSADQVPQLKLKLKLNCLRVPWPLPLRVRGA